MGLYVITGADKSTGNEMKMVLEAMDPTAAQTEANRRGMLVEECHLAPPSKSRRVQASLGREPVAPERSTETATERYLREISRNVWFIAFWFKLSFWGMVISFLFWLLIWLKKL